MTCQEGGTMKRTIAVSILTILLLTPSLFSQEVPEFTSLWTISSRSGIRDISVENGIAATVSKFQLADFSDLQHPRIFGDFTDYRYGESFEAVEIRDDFAYLVTHTPYTFRIIDIGNPLAPVEIGRVDIDDFIFNLVLSDTLAVIANWTGGVTIIDISDPFAPEEVGHYQSNNSQAVDVRCAAPYVYVANRSYGLEVLNINDPANPLLLDTYHTPGHSMGLDLRNDTLFVADSSAFRIFDVSDPASLQQIGWCPVSGTARTVRVREQWAYSTLGDSGVSVIDFSDPENPVETEVLELSGTPYALDLQDNYALVASLSAGIHFLDISNPAEPYLSHDFAGQYEMTDVVFHDEEAYAISDLYGLMTIDGVRTAIPQIIQVTPLNQQVNQIALFQDHLYL